MTKSTKKQRRCMALLNAYLVYHATKLPKVGRENTSWLYLLVWAERGGRPSDAVGLGGKS